MDIVKNFDKLRRITALDNAQDLAGQFNKLHNGAKFNPENVIVTPHYYTSVTQETVPFLCSGDKLYLSKPTIIELSENLYELKIDDVLKDINSVIMTKDSITNVSDYEKLIQDLPVNEYIDVVENHFHYIITMVSNLKTQFPTVDFNIDSELHINQITKNIVPLELTGEEINNTPNTIKPTKVSISAQSIYLIWNNSVHVTKQSLHEFTEMCMNQLYRILNTGILEPLLSIQSLESHVSTGNL